MLSFKPLSLGDKKAVDNICNVENSRSADFVFGNMFLWNDKYRQSICISDGRLFVRAEGEHVPIFPFPIGSGDLAKAIEKLLSYTREQGYNLVLRGVELHHKEQLEALFPGHFNFIHDRDYDDYIYSAEKLASLSGKKLHGKRNHINRFVAENPDWKYEQITTENIEEVREMHKQWCKVVDDGSKHGLSDESCAVRKALKFYNELQLSGGLIRANGKVVAFSLGDRLNDKTFLVHIEKAFSGVTGAYQIINREFVLHNCMEYEFVNREDDTGDESLRKAKLSYYPVFLPEKYEAWLNYAD